MNGRMIIAFIISILITFDIGFLVGYWWNSDKRKFYPTEPNK